MKALVIIDMQNDFITGALGAPEAQAIVPKVISCMEGLNTIDTLVIATKDTHGDDYLTTFEGRKLPISHCIFETEGWHIQKEISTLMDSGNFAHFSSANVINSRVIKHTFGSMELTEVLRSADAMKPIDEIILVGLCTDICVIANAILLKTAFPETVITVDASCCAGVTPDSHRNALNAMKMLQINVINEGV